MRFPADPKALALLPFTAFLLNHIDDIRPSLIVFLFAPGHEDYITQIAEPLAGRPMRFVRMSNGSHPNFPVIKDHVLLLSFVGVCHHSSRWVRFESAVRTFVITLEGGNTTGGAFKNWPLQLNPYPCIAWRSTRSTDSDNEMDEADFLQSFYWSIFTDRLTTLDGRQPISVGDNFQTDRMGTQHSKDKTNVLITTGFRIGIYKILGELLHAEYLRYYPIMQFNKKSGNRGTSMIVREERLTAEFTYTNRLSINVLSLNPSTHILPLQFPHGALRTRYLMVVPRIVLDSASNRFKEYWTKALVVLGLMLSTGFFVVIRFVCRLGENGQWPVGGSAWWVHSFFDTWARTLSVEAGQWLGRSTAERQMLTVIAVFAFLAGSIFSGVLYKQQLVQDEVRFLYNSLDDICLAGMVLNVPQELIPGYTIVNRRRMGTMFLPSSNCTVTLRAYGYLQNEVNEAVSALVVPDNAFRVLNYSQQKTMVLDQPYLIFPAKIGLQQRYMETLVVKWLTRLVDHGFLEAFTRTSDNYERMLDIKRLRLGEIIVEDARPVDPMFEYWVLAVGLSMAGLAFVGELVGGGRLDAFPWRKSNRVQSV